MELNIKFDEKLMVETANRVLDEYEYNGKTIREWADLIANPKTNADRIRSMTDEELADFLWSIGSNPVTGNYYLNGKLLFFCGNGNGWLDWLRQEAHDDPV